MQLSTPLIYLTLTFPPRSCTDSCHALPESRIAGIGLVLLDREQYPARCPAGVVTSTSDHYTADFSFGLVSICG